MNELTLVTSHDCHFCDHGRELLAELGIEAREVPIESEQAEKLAAQGVPLAFLPVLWDGARVVAYGRFSEKRLRREFGL